MIGSVEKAWRLISPGHCLKNRPLSPLNSSVIQRQPEGRGPLKPSDRAVFGEINSRIVLGDIETGKNIGLKNLSADIWKAIIKHGDRNQAISALLAEYDVEEARLAQDLNAFVNNLLNRGLLIEET
jgi:hypothetical protein